MTGFDDWSIREIIFSKDNVDIFDEYFDSFLIREYDGVVKNSSLGKSVIQTHFEVEDLS